MGIEQCIAEVTKAAGRDLSDTELDDLVEELGKRQKERLASQTIEDVETALNEAAQEIADDMERGALIAKRHAALNFQARTRQIDFIRSQFSGNETLGVEAMLVGVNKPGLGTRSSVAAEQESLNNFYGGGFVSDVEGTGNWKMFVSGALDRDIARALWALDLDEARLPKLPPEAVEIAKVIRKWQTVARTDANRAGAYIGKLEGYIVRQGHDVYRIKSAGFDAWKADILPRLDIARTFGDDSDLDKALLEIWKGLSSGNHMKAPQTPKASGFKGPRNIAKRVSAERVLHFKSADDWFDYNQSFGTGSMREAVLRGFELSAQNTGLMKKLGPNPEANFDQIIETLAGRMDDSEKLTNAAKPGGYLRGRLSVVDGSARIPVNQMGARISAGVRTVQNMAKLGGAVVSSVTDIPVYASEMRFQGGSMLSGMAEALGSLFKGRNRAEMAELDGTIGVFMDGMKADVVSRFSIAEDGVPGRLSAAQRVFFKFNGLTWWTDTVRASAVRATAHRVAFHAGKSFDQLDEDFRRVIGLYGIDAPRWDIVRKATPKMADGRAYATPEAILELPDNLFNPILPAGKETPRRIANAKRDLADQLRAYYSERGNIAVIEPDARTRAIMTRGARPGSFEGEMFRFIGQFKSFSFALTQNVVGREIYGRGSDSLSQALRNGNGEMAGMAQLILWTTLFGYGAMAAKDLAKGREPRDPASAKTWLAAFTQGGGGGIYGDFLFGEMRTRFGGGPIATALGPTVGTAEDILDIIGRMREGDDATSAAVRTAISNTPFANLIYTRTALDYLILYRIQESLNPGSVRRMERRIEKENDQTFLLSPSAAAR